MLPHNPFQQATPPVGPDQQKTPRRQADPTSGTPIMTASIPATSGRVTLIGYLPWPIATATGISIHPNSQQSVGLARPSPTRTSATLMKTRMERSPAASL